MTIYRDACGIPHIEAADANQVAFEQGRATALDRAWQLDAEHRRGTGRLAEVLGPTEVEWDAFARRLRIDGVAAESFELLDPQTRAFLSAYADGVNAVLDDTALPWNAWTPVSVFLMHQVVFGPMLTKIWRSCLAGQLGAGALRLFSPETAQTSGSNAFAVGGGRTVSGLPLVAGDPHRLFEVPNVYAQVHLVCPAFDVIGFAFPGVPGVQHFGHAGEVAWGLTNASADYEDAFEEDLRRTADGIEARGASGWAPVDVRTETIRVLDADDVTVEALTTVRGPVVVGDPETGRAFSVRATWWATADLGMETLLPLLHARSTADVVAAFAHWVVPVNNVVVADRAGDVRQFVAGAVPHRPHEHWSVAVPAADGPEWTGWVDPLPHQQAAPDGVLVSANHRISTAYDVLGDSFAAPFRARRIEELLAGRDRWDVGSAGAVLGDVLQTAGVALLDRIAGLHGLSPAGERVRSRLSSWDRQMRADSDAAALFVSVREAVVAAICDTPALGELRGPDGVPPWMLAWFDVPGRVASALHVWMAEPAPLGIDLDAILRRALDGVDVDGPWGEHHRYTGFGTPPTPPPARRPLPGDTDCVFAAGKVVGTDAAHRGPVARYVWDLADRRRSRWVVPLGAAAESDDQACAWAAGATVPVELDLTLMKKDDR